MPSLRVTRTGSHEICERGESTAYSAGRICTAPEPRARDYPQSGKTRKRHLPCARRGRSRKMCSRTFPRNSARDDAASKSQKSERIRLFLNLASTVAVRALPNVPAATL